MAARTVGRKLELWEELRPSGVADPELVYDTVTKTVIQYGGAWGDGTPQKSDMGVQCSHEDVDAEGTQHNSPAAWAGSVPGAYIPQPGLVYNPNTHKVLYHQTSGTGAPADWQYDPVADTWTLLTESGGGVSGPDATMAYDLANNKLITWSYLPGSAGCLAGNVCLRPSFRATPAI